MNVIVSTSAKVQTLFFFVSLCLCVRPSSFSAEEHDPESEHASFTIAPGFNVSLFASEKDGVVKPIQIRFDSHGLRVPNATESPSTSSW